MPLNRVGKVKVPMPVGEHMANDLDTKKDEASSPLHISDDASHPSEQTSSAPQGQRRRKSSRGEIKWWTNSVEGPMRCCAYITSPRAPIEFSSSESWGGHEVALLSADELDLCVSAALIKPLFFFKWCSGRERVVCWCSFTAPSYHGQPVFFLIS